MILSGNRLQNILKRLCCDICSRDALDGVKITTSDPIKNKNKNCTVGAHAQIKGKFKAGLQSKK
jgi:hypothetical protein